MSVILCLLLSACSPPEPANSEITKEEHEAIMRRLSDWGTTGPTDETKITRLSVDTFLAEHRGLSRLVSLREDGIITEGDLTSDEIESIKQTANAKRRWKHFEISSIKQKGPESVEVWTGFMGGEVITFVRSNKTWVVKAVGQWNE